MDILLVGIGGVFGAVARYQLGILISKHSNTKYPVGTFMINITGALLLGFLSGLGLGKSVYLLFGDGFLGAYTTFSTFMYEGFNLFRDKRTLNALVYITGSLILGVIGYLIGYKIGAPA
jgi:CrcB protein